MYWHKILINHNEEFVGVASVTALGRILTRAISDSQGSTDFEAWHLQMSKADHIFYLSPKASEYALPLINSLPPEKRYGLEKCAEKPNLDGFHRWPL